MRKLACAAGLSAAVALVATLAAFAQEGSRPEAAVDRYVPALPSTAACVLDTASGALYFQDPAGSNAFVTLDLVGCHAFVRDVARDASGWGTVDLPKLDAAVVPARAHTFVTVAPYEVLDTRTGALYFLEGGPPKAPVLEWKNVKVVREDPVLGTRATRELHVSKRGT